MNGLLSERDAPLHMDHGSTIVRVNMTEMFGVIMLGIIALVLLRALPIEIERNRRASSNRFQEGR